MIRRRATLKVDNLECEILRCSYAFSRKTDTKGRPTTGIKGGTIQVLLESPEDNFVLRRMLLKVNPLVKGSVKLIGGEDDLCIRRIEFDKAYIYSYAEVLQTCSPRPPMASNIRISLAEI